MQELRAQPVAEAVSREVLARAQTFESKHGRKPGLVVVLVGEDPGSVIYTTKKGTAAEKAGIRHETIRLPASASPAEVKAVLDRLNADITVDGILLQRPLPSGGPHFKFKEEELSYWVAPEKDVDAFHPENLGRSFLGLPALTSCTPSGVMEILKHYGIPVAGKHAVIVGRSAIVGKPMAALLVNADATVTMAHSKTRNLQELTLSADLLIAAIGKPGFITGAHVRSGAVVIDVGINRGADGKVVGDVLYAEVIKKAAAVTPVPGGVGPMTIAMLLRNTVQAAEMRAASSHRQ